MLRAFTRGSQEKNNSPTVDSQFSDEHYYPSRDKHPENNEHKAPIKPQSWPGHPRRLVMVTTPGSGAGCTCVWPGGRVAEAGEDICSSSRSCPWAESVTTHNTFNAPGARGWGNENKTPDVHCQQPHRGRCWQLSTSYVLSSLSEHRGVEEEYVVVVVCISQLARSALCFIRWELHRPRLISGLLLPLILHILGEQ